LLVSVPPQKALDLFRPGFDENRQPIPFDKQKTYTTRINITFRFYREDFHPLPSFGPYGPREGVLPCKCGIPTLLRADQKAKVRSILASSGKKDRESSSTRKNEKEDEDSSALGIVEDDMVFFWQCQSTCLTGDLKGCGFFKILDMKAEGRGPCIIDMQ
jgi:hypothetical protein